jgi:hypothetical protein
MKKLIVAGLLAALPMSGFAFEALDAMAAPTTGRFPAYPPDEAAGPTEVFVQAGVMRDSNLLRLQSDRQSDWVTRYGAGLRHEGRVIGRQSILVEARADHYAFDRFSALDHTAYGLLGEWRWELGNELSGTAGYRRREILAPLGEIQAARKDLVTTEDVFATGGYRFAANWRARLGADRTTTKHTGGGTPAGVNTVTGGIDYFTPLGNALGVEYRRTQGAVILFDAAGFIIFNSDYSEREVAVVGTYVTGTTIRTTGRFGRTHRETELLPGHDFNGNTGRLSLDWLATNKTIFGFTWWREARAVVDLAANFVLSRGVAFGPRWAPTAKLNFAAAIIRDRRNYLGDPLIVTTPGLPQRDEVLRTVRLAADWEVVRHAEIGAAIDYGERDSNILGRSYRYNAVMLNAKMRF